MQLEKQIGKMIEQQKKINTQTNGENWKEKKRNWDLAMFTELAELTESTPWKWYKKTELDMENIIVELVDIFHFLLSSLINNDIKQEMIVKIIHNEIRKTRNERGQKVIEKRIEDFAKTLFQENWEIKKLTMFIRLVMALSSWGNLYKIYRGKNILNIFRQDNGYKEGYYIKVWEQEEDNNFMYREMLEMGIEDIDKLYSILDSRYMEILGSKSKEEK